MRLYSVRAASLLLLLAGLIGVFADPYDFEDPSIFINAAGVAATMIGGAGIGKEFTPDLLAKAVRRASHNLQMTANPVASGKSCEDILHIFDNLVERFPPFVENAGKVPCSPFVDPKLTLEALQLFSKTKGEMVPMILEQCPKSKKAFQANDTALDSALEEIIAIYRDRKCETKKKVKSGKKASKDAEPGRANKNKESARIDEAIEEAKATKDRDEL